MIKQNQKIERKLLIKKLEIIVIKIMLEDITRIILKFEHQIDVFDSEK